MKKNKQKTGGVVKGGPSGFMISLLIHAAAFVLAGMLVVFNVVKKEEKKFVPPPAVERPKMKLRKPKVKVKKSAKPKQTKRIVTKVQRANMPDIQLPELSGVADGLGGGLGGFELIPDLGEVSMFGGTTSIGNDLEGVMYDLKRFKNGRTSGIYENEGIINVVEKFLRKGWRSSVLAQYYRSPRKLYSPMIMVPPTDSALGPWAFGERDMDPWAFLLHYKGQLVHKDGIKFRFVAMGDNYLVIRVNGKVVLDYKNQFASAVNSPAFKPLSYHLGHWYAYGSDWIELEPGVPQDIEFILGDYKGYLFASMIAVEEYGVDYPKAPLPLDNPMLPIFKTAKLSRDQKEAVSQQMWLDHLDLDGGPVFSDYDAGSDEVGETDDVVEPVQPEEVEVAETTAIRSWTLSSGKTIDAEYLSVMGGKVVLKTARGKVLKVAASEFSEADQDLLQLLNPPELEISFKKDTKQFEVKSNPDLDNPIPSAIEFAGVVSIKQEDEKLDYQRPLRLEFFVIADEHDGDNFILYDHQIEDFELNPSNNRSFQLSGRKDLMLRYEHYSGKVRGEKYKGYMALVFNEKDEIIAKKMSHDWLFDLREELLDLPVGCHFDKEGKRVYPPRPIFTDRYWDAEP